MVMMNLQKQSLVVGRAGVTATSARHREMLAQFGRVYKDGYAPALNVRRSPIRYTARDLFA